MSDKDCAASLVRSDALLAAWDSCIERLEAEGRKRRQEGNDTRAVFVEGKAAGYAAAYRDLQVAVAANSSIHDISDANTPQHYQERKAE